MSFFARNRNAEDERPGYVLPLFPAHQPLTLRAASVSSGVFDALERRLPLEVLRVHDQSLNLLCGDEVLSLVGTESGNLPRGIVVDPPLGASWKDLSVAGGSRARVEGRYLWLSREVRVDLVPGSVWESRRYLRSIVASPDRVRMAVESAAARLVTAGGLGGVASEIESLVEGREPEVSSELLFYPVAVRSLAGLMGALSHSDRSGLLEQSKRLVGLGIGLTPSGDDVLTGMLGSLVLISDHVSALAWVRSVGAELASWAWGRTHPVSLTYLRCAANGEIAEIQERLLHALVSGDPVASVAACDSLRRFGHSSGGEIALGTLLVVEAAARHFWPTGTNSVTAG